MLGFSLKRHSDRAIDRIRKMLSGLCGAFLLFSILFSSFFVIAEADHDCTGEECPTCVRLQVCLESFQLTGTPLPNDAALLSDKVEAFHLIEASEFRAPATTLQSLYVRLDE